MNGQIEGMVKDITRWQLAKQKVKDLRV